MDFIQKFRIQRMGFPELMNNFKYCQRYQFKRVTDTLVRRGFFNHFAFSINQPTLIILQLSEY